ncbi:MAG: thiamine-phosphate kinase [Alphaproteobacteria bacterium]|nr:thiamine-phosphate kinase [Alphaproteobacteria bacterium]
MTSKIENLGEFDRIETFLKPLAAKLPGAFCLHDDAAQLGFPANTEIVVTTDTLVSGIHFLGNEKPSSIARKVLATNLSDLAAKGAKPFAYSLSLALPPSIDDIWFSSFVEGLSFMQNKYDLALLGGDSTKTPNDIVITASLIGIVDKDVGMIQRGTAAKGDYIYVSGSIGDGAFGLSVARGDLQDDYLLDRYQHPRPRLEYIDLLKQFATASMDISDGLLADAEKMGKASDVCLCLEKSKIPLSESVRKIVDRDSEAFETVVTGGDDYELLFTVAAENVQHLEASAKDNCLSITRIGIVVDKQESFQSLIDLDGKHITFEKLGFTHR